MRKLLALAMSASLILPGIASAAAKPPVSLAKTSKWEVKYDADACHLAARFGEGPEAIVLQMTRYALGETFDLTLTGESLATKERFPGFEIGFVPTPKLQRQPATSGTSSNNQPVVMVGNLRLDNLEIRFSQASKPGDQSLPLPPLTAEREAAITGLEFRIGGFSRILATRSMRAPMEAMRTCTWDLIRSWGFDPQVQATLSKPPLPSNYPGYWVTTNDYPTQALRQEISGIVQYRLDIDETGKVTGCRILARTSPDAFGDRTCNLLKLRAKMSPALDRESKPVKSFHVGSVRWLVPAH